MGLLDRIFDRGHEPIYPRPQPPVVPPVPPPQPPSNRLGNPSVSEILSFTYGENPTPSTMPPAPEPLPPIAGGEATELVLTSDKTHYQWGDKATLTATLIFRKDGAPLYRRPVAFNIQGTTFVQFTNERGQAVIQYIPFGVPGPGQPDTMFYAFVVFLGY